MTTTSDRFIGTGQQEITEQSVVFARHETFHPRFGWLKKGFDAAIQEPEIFLKKDANVILGVGKNMVQSIRYWCAAFKVLSDPARRVDNQNEAIAGKKFHPTELGNRLLGDQGWDTFLEDSASLWLLHWNLLKPPCYATAWHFVFNRFNQPEFLYKQLLAELSNYRNSQAPHIADSSIEKDAKCILKMYCGQPDREGINEETIDCPFTELGIIYPIARSDRYAFRLGRKVSLPAEIIVAACLEFADWTSGQHTIVLSRLLFELNSPGMIFKLSESALHEAIDRVARWSNQISISSSAGLVQLAFDRDPMELYWEILEEYYSTRRAQAIL